MKKLITLTIAAAIAVSLCGCGRGYVSPERAEREAANGLNWTVLIYMCGGAQESRHGAASSALKEMCLTDYPENVNIIVQTGGSSEWEIDGIYGDYLQRFEMQKDGMYMVDQKLASNMGSYGTLTDFLKWGVNAYPAERYAVFIWDGGAGTGGVSHDELNGDGLSLEELSYGIGITDKNYDLIAFDASLMSNIEAASALAPYADYMVASPEYMPVGLDYESIFNYLAKNPDTSVADFGKVICDTYYARCEDNKTDDNAVMTLIDLSRMSSLMQAFDGMAGIMLTATDGLANYARISRASRLAHRYGGQTDYEGYSNCVDVGDLAVKLAEYVGQPSDILRQILNEAVIYKTENPELSQSADISGLGVFYPFMTDADDGYRQNVSETIMTEYLQNARSANYANYLRKICTNLNMPYEEGAENYTSSWAWVDFNAQRGGFSHWVRVNEQNMLELDMLGNMDLIRNVAFNLYRHDDTTGERLMLGRDYNTEVSWDGGVFVDDFTFEIFELNGSPVMTLPIDGGMYSVPVLLNGERTNLRVKAVTDETGEASYEVLGAWEGVDWITGLADRNFRHIKFRDKITPLLKSLDTGEFVQGETITIGPFGVSLKKKAMPTGNYTFAYDVKDIYAQSEFDIAGPVRIDQEQMDWSAAVGL